jgi:hypothetical protein
MGLNEGGLHTGQSGEVDQDKRWHLFRVRAEDEAGQWAYVVSAESRSQLKARELAEGAVLDDAGTEEAPGKITDVSYLGKTDSDIFEKVVQL